MKGGYLSSEQFAPSVDVGSTRQYYTVSSCAAILHCPTFLLLALPGDSTTEIACGTCFCDVERHDTTTMDCGHTFCNDCWRQHCRIQISEGRSRQLACMAAGCGAICDESRVCGPGGLRLLPLQ